MALPSDLIVHYSSKAFQTRLAALTVIGAVLVGTSKWFKDAEESNIVGFLLILVVSSLGELNRRYSYSYLCACYAATRRGRHFSNEAKEAAVQWIIFRITNETPWRSPLARFLLSWSTYFPGIILGGFLILRQGEPVAIGWVGLGLALLVLLQWIYYSICPLNPADYRNKKSIRNNLDSQE